MSNLKYLNLGCGTRFHKEWLNIDFTSKSEHIIAHNLLAGIPFEDNSMDVIYHSHVLEHFSKEDGEKFISECYRVLKPNGIIRIAVPDLERIVGEYQKNLKLALSGDQEAAANYDWIMIEMYDQAVRQKSGGLMADYIFRQHIPNEAYVYERIGEEGRLLRKLYLDSLNQKSKPTEIQIDKRSFARKILSALKQKLKRYLFKNEIAFFEQERKYAELGRFRLGGEVHQWMYDRFSLGRLLKKQGFLDIEIKTAFDSAIPNWNSFELESKNGIVYKPDSLFVEAKK